MAPDTAALQLRYAYMHILSECGLQPGLTGRTFLFGQADHMVECQIRSVGYDAGKPLKFYVTAPRYRGLDIKYIERRTYDIGDDKEEVRWFAIGLLHKADDESGENEKEGLLIFLD